jgi:hypothetical protein
MPGCQDARMPGCQDARMQVAGCMQYRMHTILYQASKELSRREFRPDRTGLSDLLQLSRDCKCTVTARRLVACQSDSVLSSVPRSLLRQMRQRRTRSSVRKSDWLGLSETGLVESLSSSSSKSQEVPLLPH